MKTFWRFILLALSCGPMELAAADGISRAVSEYTQKEGAPQFVEAGRLRELLCALANARDIPARMRELGHVTEEKESDYRTSFNLTTKQFRVQYTVTRQRRSYHSYVRIWGNLDARAWLFRSDAQARQFLSGFEAEKILKEGEGEFYAVAKHDGESSRDEFSSYSWWVAVSGGREVEIRWDNTTESLNQAICAK